ncbi:MAG: hypothetical protein HY907_21480 [Deltaproteobacteria bacterium]|nr:hypothetical protein [Deltaproteobacteria bacterium]
MRDLRFAWLLALAGMIGPGCAAPFGTLGPDGYRSNRFAFRVPSEPDGSFISNDWVVDNFRRVRDEWAPKTGVDFETELRLDVDGDGEWDGLGSVPTYELLLRNRRDAGKIWVRALPMSSRFDETELRVLARTYVNDVSGAGTVVTVSAQEEGTVVVTTDSHRFATRTIEEGPLAVGGFEAWGITFEVADVDQLSLSADSRWNRARVIFVRAGFLWLSPASLRPGAPFPVAFMLGYSNLPEDFAGGLADFEHFVGSLDWLDDELSDERSAVLECTDEEMVRILHIGRDSRREGGLPGQEGVWSPDVSYRELGCFASEVADLDLSFAARRAPYAAPAPVVPVVAPSQPAPDDSPSGGSEPPGAWQVAPEEAAIPPVP